MIYTPSNSYYITSILYLYGKKKSTRSKTFNLKILKGVQIFQGTLPSCFHIYRKENNAYAYNK